MSAPILTLRAADVALQNYLAACSAGRRLKWAREAAGISQRELAAYSGISPTTLRRIERGERTMQGAERAVLARALGTSLSMLLPTNGIAGNGSRTGHKAVAA